MKNNSGFALMAVLFISAVVSTLALGYATTARLKALQVRYGQEKVEEFFRLTSGLEIGLHEYKKYILNRSLLERREEIEAVTGKFLELWYPRFEPYVTEIDGKQYEIQLLNESGKFDINNVSPEILLKVLKLCGADEPDAFALVDAILDFIDTDDNHRLNGAENDFYMSLDVPYSCKNQPFENIEELLLVRGVSSELFFGNNEHPGLIDMLSILGDPATLDINSASPKAFAIIDNLPSAVAQAVVSYRLDEPITDLNELSEIISYEFLNDFKDHFSVHPDTHLTITAIQKLDGDRQGGWLSMTRSSQEDQKS